MNEIPEGMKALHAQIELCALGFTATRWADALLAPDGPLWPALRALGDEDMLATEDEYPGAGDWLADRGITGPLADACLAAAEVKP